MSFIYERIKNAGDLNRKHVMLISSGFSMKSATSDGQKTVVNYRRDRRTIRFHTNYKSEVGCVGGLVIG